MPGGEETIYVVVQGSGEYSDRNEYPLRAYRTEAAAAAFVAACEAHVSEGQMHTPGEPGYAHWTEKEWRTWRRSNPIPEYRVEADGPFGGMPDHSPRDYAICETTIYDTFTLGI